jgi:hypothetical protein
VLGNPELLAYRLAELMPSKTEAQYLAILKSGKKFAYLERRAIPELVKAVNALGEPAIEFQREPSGSIRRRRWRAMCSAGSTATAMPRRAWKRC